MKKTLLMFAVIGMLSSCGGGDKKTEGGDAAKESSSEAPKEITLKEAKGDKIGAPFTIQIPDGAKELQNNEMGWTYSLVLPDGINEINVNVHKAAGEIANLEGALKYTNFMAEVAAKDQKAVGNDFFIVKQPQGTLQETWYFAKAKEGYIATKVTAPATQEAITSKIAQSLKAN